MIFDIILHGLWKTKPSLQVPHVRRAQSPQTSRNLLNGSTPISRLHNTPLAVLRLSSHRVCRHRGSPASFPMRDTLVLRLPITPFSSQLMYVRSMCMKQSRWTRGCLGRLFKCIFRCAISDLCCISCFEHCHMDIVPTLLHCKHRDKCCSGLTADRRPLFCYQAYVRYHLHCIRFMDFTELTSVLDEMGHHSSICIRPHRASAESENHSTYRTLVAGDVHTLMNGSSISI